MSQARDLNLAPIFEYVLSMMPGEAIDRNIFKANVLMKLLMDLGSVVSRPYGTLPVDKPYQKSKNTTVTSYEGRQPLNFVLEEHLAHVQFALKQMMATVTMTHTEERNLMKRGKLAIVDTLSDKLDTAFKTFSEDIDTALYGDGTGNDSKDYDGLDTYITATPSSGTYGNNGVLRSSNTRFQNQYQTTTDFVGEGLTSLGTLFRSCSKAKGIDEPEAHITSPTLFGKYEKIADATDRHVLEKRYKDLGWLDCAYKGKPVLWDSTIASTKWFMLNSMDFEFIKDTDVWMEVIPKDIPGELAKGYVIVCWANMIFYKVDRQGLLVASG